MNRQKTVRKHGQRADSEYTGKSFEQTENIQNSEREQIANRRRINSEQTGYTHRKGGE